MCDDPADAQGPEASDLGHSGQGDHARAEFRNAWRDLTEGELAEGLVDHDEAIAFVRDVRDLPELVPFDWRRGRIVEIREDEELRATRGRLPQSIEVQGPSIPALAFDGDHAVWHGSRCLLRRLDRGCGRSVTGLSAGSGLRTQLIGWQVGPVLGALGAPGERNPVAYRSQDPAYRCGTTCISRGRSREERDAHQGRHRRQPCPASPPSCPRLRPAALLCRGPCTAPGAGSGAQQPGYLLLVHPWLLGDPAVSFPPWSSRCRRMRRSPSESLLATVPSGTRSMVAISRYR